MDEKASGPRGSDRLFGCGAAPAFAYTALYSFGDSLSDVGNVFTASGGTNRRGRPHLAGRPAITPAVSATDRIGSTICSAKLGLGAVTASIDGGDDFAFGGAQTGPTSVNPAFFSTDLDRSGRRVRVQHPSPDVKRALYPRHRRKRHRKCDLAAFAQNSHRLSRISCQQAVTNTVGAIDTLYDDGARDLLYYEVPDLSIVPAFEAAGPARRRPRHGDSTRAFSPGSSVSNRAGPAHGLRRAHFQRDSEDLVADPASNGLTNVRSLCVSRQLRHARNGMRGLRPVSVLGRRASDRRRPRPHRQSRLCRSDRSARSDHGA